jgi:predicted nicotinamide N-methyase
MILCWAGLGERGLPGMNESGSAHARLFEVPGGWKDCQLDIGGVSLRLTIPADPERVLDAHVAAITACDPGPDDEPPDPYWATLWSAATPTAEAVLRASWPEGTTVLELGCGIGLVGIAALMRGWRVTFSDCAPQAIRVALENARQNGYPQAQSLLIDWQDPPPVSYDVILASDVLYHRASHAPLLSAIEQLMAPAGICWIGDPGRLVARKFVQTAADRFHVQLRDRDGQEFGVPHVGEFQLLVLRRRDRWGPLNQ